VHILPAPTHRRRSDVTYSCSRPMVRFMVLEDSGAKRRRPMVLEAVRGVRHRSPDAWSKPVAMVSDSLAIGRIGARIRRWLPFEWALSLRGDRSRQTAGVLRPGHAGPETAQLSRDDVERVAGRRAVRRPTRRSRLAEAGSPWRRVAGSVARASPSRCLDDLHPHLDRSAPQSLSVCDLLAAW